MCITPNEPSKTSRNFKTLVAHLRQFSISDSQEEIVAEWEHLRFWECTKVGVCRCSKTGIVEHNAIIHKATGLVVEPIGSSCIRLFPEDMQEQFKEARDDYLQQKRNRIAKMKVGWGKYAHMTFLKLALHDSQYAEWLLGIPKYTAKTRHPCFHPDNKEIRKLLKKGIEQNRT
jgi:hypothetical protein